MNTMPLPVYCKDSHYIFDFYFISDWHMQSLHLHLAVRNRKTNLVLNYDWSFSPLLISLIMLVFVFEWFELPSIVIVDFCLDQMITVCCLNSYCTAFSVEYTSIVMFSILAFAEKKAFDSSSLPFYFLMENKECDSFITFLKFTGPKSLMAL